MDNKGFTLIELIVTVGIVAVLMAVVLPRIDIGSGYADRVARGLLTDLRYVQSEHMKNPETQYQIYLDISKGRYQVRSSFDVFTPGIEKEVVLRDGCTFSYTNAQGMANYKYAKLYFTSSGAPVNAGTITVRDTVRDEERQITIVPATGRTIIKE